jgi:hypothetical protein
MGNMRRRGNMGNMGNMGNTGNTGNMGNMRRRGNSPGGLKFIEAVCWTNDQGT